MDPRNSYYKAKEEAEASQNPCVTCVIFGIFILSALLIVCLVLAILGLGIAEIVIGAIYLHDCEVQRLLPIFLIVLGCSGFLASCCSSSDRNEEEEGWNVFSIGRSCMSLIFYLFQLAWLTAGTIWVIEVRDVIYAPGHCQPNSTMLATLGISQSTTEKCVTCNEVLTDFAFAVVIIYWSFMGLSFVLMTLCGLRFCFLRMSE